MVEDDLLHSLKAAILVKVKAKGEKSRSKKLKRSELHETQESGIKNFSIQITFVDLASEQTAGNQDTNCVESMGEKHPPCPQKGLEEH